MRAIISNFTLQTSLFLLLTAALPAAERPQRLLLIGQGPDSHPFLTHEYRAGVGLVAKLLQPVEDLQTIVVSADGEWKDGPQLIDSADGVVLFVSEGARWIEDDPARLAAFQRLAKRGGGFAVLHWGMGTREAKHIDNFVALFGGCHGGPDRKYKVVTATTQIAAKDHPVMRGVEPLTLKDEFYYKLKFPKPPEKVTPLLKVPIDDEDHTVAWAWSRPETTGGGRSFGFSGLHFHENWKHEPYRRMVAQGVLWTLKLPIPKNGLAVTVKEKDLTVPPRKQKK